MNTSVYTELDLTIETARRMAADAKAQLPEDEWNTLNMWLKQEFDDFIEMGEEYIDAWMYVANDLYMYVKTEYEAHDTIHLDRYEVYVDRVNRGL